MWSNHTILTRHRSLRFWLGINECRFLVGDRRFFLSSRAVWQSLSTAQPLASLFKMRRLDSRRHWNLSDTISPLGMNIKRAEGGLLDGDFVKTLGQMMGKRSVQAGGCASLFQQSRIIRAQLFLIKSVLHDHTGAPRESAFFERECGSLPPIARRNHVALLLREHRTVLETLERKHCVE